MVKPIGRADGKLLFPTSNQQICPTRSKDTTFGAPVIATRNKKLLGAPGLTTRSKGARPESQAMRSLGFPPPSSWNS